MSWRDVLRHCDGRYLTPEERGRALAFAYALPQRVRAGEEVEVHEDAAVEATCTGLREAYPRFGRIHPQAWERLAQDLRLVLRADVRAMLADDPNAVEDLALNYLRSIWTAYQVTPTFGRDACQRLADHLRGALSAESFAALEPFLDRNRDVFGSIPEPAVAAV
jgi:Phycobilisome protein